MQKRVVNYNLPARRSNSFANNIATNFIAKWLKIVILYYKKRAKKSFVTSGGSIAKNFVALMTIFAHI